MCSWRAAGEILCYKSSSLCPLRVEWLTRLEHPVGKMQELAHRRPDHSHLTLASLAQTFRPMPKEGAAPQSSDRREVERLA